MKKIIVSFLLVLLAICLFVGCSSSPKEEELPQSVSFIDIVEQALGYYDKYTMDQAGNCSVEVKNDNGLKTFEWTYTIDSNGMGLYNEGQLVINLYKNNACTESVKDYKELVNCENLYYSDEVIHTLDNMAK